MKRILLNWYYFRPDLTNYLLEMTDEFELIFIFFHSPPKENNLAGITGKNVSIIYWGDFKSPYQLLNKIRPDIVVFHDIETFNQVALNVAARNKKIPTYVLQHGIRGGYEVNQALSLVEKQPISLSNTTSWSIKFFLSSFQLINICNVYSILKFIINRKKYELTRALTKSHGEWRNADYYIELSKENTSYHKERDGIADNRFLIIGNPQFDTYFQKLDGNKSEEKEPYCLLIDCPFCEAVFQGSERMTPAEKNDYLKSISGWCRNRGLRLYVKLHPLTFNTDYLFNDGNITYFNDADITSLIEESNLVFFVHFSSLTPIIIHYKPFVFLETKYLPFNDFFQTKGIEIINMEDFTAEANVQPHSPLTAEELENVLYKTDGKATERLRSILRGSLSTINDL
jgi:hypothetical protein